MTPDRALEIVRAINAMAFATMGLSQDPGDLAGVTLAEMLEAKAIVMGSNPRAGQGGLFYTMVPDDRLISAAYTFLHYAPSNAPILCLPGRGVWPDTHVALAVVPITPSDEEDEE